MTNTTKQIIISVVATVAAGVILEYIRPKVTPPPVVDDQSQNSNWWGF